MGFMQNLSSFAGGVGEGLLRTRKDIREQQDADLRRQLGEYQVKGLEETERYKADMQGATTPEERAAIANRYGKFDVAAQVTKAPLEIQALQSQEEERKLKLAGLNRNEDFFKQSNTLKTALSSNDPNVYLPAIDQIAALHSSNPNIGGDSKSERIPGSSFVSITPAGGGKPELYDMSVPANRAKAFEAWQQSAYFALNPAEAIKDRREAQKHELEGRKVGVLEAEQKAKEPVYAGQARYYESNANYLDRDKGKDLTSTLPKQEQTYLASLESIHKSNLTELGKTDPSDPRYAALKKQVLESGIRLSDRLKQNNMLPEDISVYEDNGVPDPSTKALSMLPDVYKIPKDKREAGIKAIMSDAEKFYGKRYATDLRGYIDVLLKEADAAPAGTQVVTSSSEGRGGLMIPQESKTPVAAPSGGWTPSTPTEARGVEIGQNISTGLERMYNAHPLVIGGRLFNQGVIEPQKRALRYAGQMGSGIIRGVTKGKP